MKSTRNSTFWIASNVENVDNYILYVDNFIQKLLLHWILFVWKHSQKCVKLIWLNNLTFKI